MGAAVFLLLVIFLLTALSNSPYVKGKLGELKVSQLLRKHFQPPTYQVLDDITVPSSNGTTQVDHVVISPYGVFVIETKNYKGWIFGKANDSKWTQTTRGKKSHFQNPARQNYAHVKALEAITGLDESVFHSLVVFTGSAEFKTSIPDEVCRLSELTDRITLKGRKLLSDADVLAATQAIKSGRLEPGFKTDYTHVKALGKRFEGTSQKGVRRGISRGVSQLVFPAGAKIMAFVGIIIIGFLLVNFLQSTVSNLDILKPKTRVQPSSHLQQVQASNAAAAKLQWEISLRCGYSIDTNRCACYDRKGVKATVEFGRCKVLATGEGK